MPGNLEEFFWGPTVTRILNEVKMNAPNHFAYLSVLSTGSYYEGTDNGQWSDFDLMLVMDDLIISKSARFTFCWDRIVPYTSVRPDNSLSECQTRIKELTNLKATGKKIQQRLKATGYVQVKVSGSEYVKWGQVDCVDPQGNLISSKVKEAFGQFVRQAVISLGYQSSVSVRTTGPAVNLQITINGRTYSVDLTLAIKCLLPRPFEAWEWPTRLRIGWPSPELIQDIVAGGFHLVAKAASSYETANGSSWRLSFSEAEWKLFWWSANAYPCLNAVLRRLKTIIKANNWYPLTSYHMKTILFYECEAKPDPSLWGLDQWSNRLIECLFRLEDNLIRGSCPNYFMSGINQFESFPHEKRYLLAQEVQQFRNILIYQHVNHGSWLAVEPSHPKQSLVQCIYPLTPPPMSYAVIS